jgi:hypothetical protein
MRSHRHWPLVCRLLLGLTGLGLFTPDLIAQTSLLTEFDVPVGIEMPGGLRRYAQSALQKSPTLRAQFAAIGAAPLVRVIIRQGKSESACVRAYSTITRHGSGRVTALVEIPTSSDVFELLAHELEHVREQMEGLDLAALARKPDSGVWLATGGAFETARAKRVGIVVADEVANAPVMTRAAIARTTEVRILRLDWNGRR